MDFGVMNTVVGSENGPDPSKPKKNHGSGFLLKQDRSGFGEDHSWSSSKSARTDDALEAPKTMSYHQQGTLLRSNSLISSSGNGSTQNMLSFSSPNNDNAEALFPSKNGGLVERSCQSPPFRLYQQQPSYIRNAGYGSGSMNASVHSPFARYRGPFTPSQWMELEHQALIYKHIVANAPIPSSLLISLKKSLNSFAFSGSPSYAPINSFGWGPFHLGFANSTDPEPGRCRRTDGKKWRCSRDAVPEQKYCERHINRGRHRSRKPVEGQNGHKTTTSSSKVVVPVAPSSGATKNNTLGGPTQLHKFKNSQPVGPTPSIDNVTNRIQKDDKGLNSKDSPFSIPKIVSFEESTHSEFGSVSSDSLIYPWPKNQSDRATWADELKSDWTRLSMSIPMASSDSPPEERLGFSPLSLAHEFDPVQLGASVDHSGRDVKQTNWIPISWGNSMGGPLGEVLNSTSKDHGVPKSSTSALNLMSEVWDGGVQLGSSPTGVLQKGSFVSLSNSSSGSSPRGDKNGPRGGSY